MKTRYCMYSHKCPACLSHDIEGGPVDIADGQAEQEVACLSCHAGWTTVYTFNRNIVHYFGEKTP